MAKLKVPASALTRKDVLKFRRRAVIRQLNGESIAQAWPAPRGRPQSELQAAWTERFALLARNRKSPHPGELEAAQMWARLGNELYAGDPNGGLWYYRDVLETAAYGKLNRYQDEKRVTTPTVRATRLSNESINAGIFEFINMTAIDWDNNGFWSSTINPSRLMVKAPGLYLIGATASLETANAGFFSCEIWYNRTSLVAANRIPKNGIDTFASCVGVQYFNVGDYVEVGIFNSANTTNYQVPNFWMVAITPEALT